MATSTTHKAPRRRQARNTYRHGDLYRALVDAGVELARTGGPQAVVLREATRRAGVVPNAAYRHFKNRAELFDAVRAAALRAVAIAMERRIAALGPERDGIAYARAMLRAVGMGYLEFARSETGLFRTAFGIPFVRLAVQDPRTAGDSKLNPFELLSGALDRLVRSRYLTDAQRPGGEYLAWSAVHGMAMLAIDGPLQGLPLRDFELLGQRLVEMVERGLKAAE